MIMAIAMISFSGCEAMFGDFLEKAPSIDITEDDVFDSKTNVETFLASIYRYGIHSNYGYGSGDTSNPAATLIAGASDEAETCAPWYDTNNWNAAAVSADHTYDPRWSLRWKAIRKIALMIKRADDVPGVSKEYAKQMKAECKVIRAMNYSEMFKIYGGVPIIDHYIEVSEDLAIPRASLQETLDFILKDLEEAIPDLPARNEGDLKGRIDQGVAYAIKSRVLLWAASPLFNTATPYLSMDNPENNKLICFGEYDESRWAAAAKAAKECLDWAEANGCVLITDQGEDKNYQYSWEQYDNDEIILAEKAHGSIGKWTWPWSPIPSPNVYAGNSGQSGITPILNHVRKYEKKDGTPQYWDPAGGNDLQAKMAELDYRFAQTICGNKMKWNNEFPTLEMYEGGRQSNTCWGGFWLHKLYPSEISESVWTYVPNSTIYQLNEIYLNFAEAMNEAYGSNVQNGYGMTATQAINKIRQRSGQPVIPSTLSKDEFREKLINERAIELAFDGFRFYDVRRWLIAQNEGIMQGDMYGIHIYKIAGTTSEFRYEPYVFETRSFPTRYYLQPFSTTEVNKGYLVQNPGY